MLKVNNNNILKFLFLLIIATSVFAYSNSYAITEPGGQYAIDKADQIKRFEHNSLDNLKMIDFFLCVMKVRADLFPNSNYKAQVNEATCEKLAGDSDEDGAKVKMADITLSCTRASNSSPQICKSWYSLAGENITYLVKVQMDAEPTTAKPNGLFTFSWCQADSSDGTCKASNLSYGQMSLSTDSGGNTVVDMYDEYGGQLFAELTSEGMTILDSDGNTLSAAASVVDSISLTLSNHKLESATGTSRQTGETFPGIGTIQLAASPNVYNMSFDAAHGLVNQDGGSATCYTLTDPDEYVHQYDLYDISTGALKSMGGGIPISVASVAGSGASVGNRGWWDYWGLHIDGSTNSSVKKLETGDTVTANADQTGLGISKDDTLTVNTCLLYTSDAADE